LRVGAGYDDSILQDATYQGGPLLSSAADLGFTGRAFRDLSVSCFGHIATLTQPSVPTQDLDEVGTGGRAAWRFFDLLSPLVEASATQWSGPHAHTLDLQDQSLAGGLRAELPGWGSLEILSQSGQQNTPNYDLSNGYQGPEARLDVDLPDKLHLHATAQSLSRQYSACYLYTTTTAVTGNTLRADSSNDWKASLAWEEEDWGTQALGRGAGLNSNGDSIDFGPHQNQYNNTSIPLGLPGYFINDNTWMKDYFSQQSSGGGLEAWLRWDGWRLEAQATVDDIQFQGRLAKGADDHFLPGTPLRHDRIVQGDLGLTVPLDVLGLEWQLGAAWTHWEAASNDSLYTYSRNLTHLDLSLLF
jgi:hypothetical protein